METIAEVGDPKAAICDAVQKYNVDLLVMGERGLGRIKRFLFRLVSSLSEHRKMPHSHFSNSKSALLLD